ncbi:MAG TPA: ribosome silencing factor [Terriglobales bacterium]|nr:ribosome silencing factor [Terriglobales bacterium]
MKKNDLRHQVAAAVAACEDKKAERLSILEMEKGSGAFTDYFVICSGSNPRQIQAISDEVEQSLSKLGLNARSVEGYKQAEWVLLDYVDFVVHVFNDKARDYYDLERLWKTAKHVSPTELGEKPRPRAAKKSAKSSARSQAKAPAKRTSRAKSVSAKRPTGRTRKTS